jgi:hypothetical protein
VRGVSVELLTVRDLALVEATARRVLELLEERQQPSSDQVASGLVDAATLARLLSVTRGTVYEHADEFGAVRLGDGPRSRLRFDVERARAAWTRRVSGGRSHEPEPPTAAPIQRAPRRRRNGATRSGVDLLPVKDREAA